jgi:peptidoglycan/LPS O-acetylase OafA/YrhL
LQTEPTPNLVEPENATTTQPAADVKPKAPRDATFDLLKGIGISEVIIHHSLSSSTRKFTTEGDWYWWLLSILNRALHFAVPTFLLASSILLARSMASKEVPDWKKYYSRRAYRTLWPYIVWTVICLAARLIYMRAESDMTTVQVTLPLLGVRTLPEIFVDGGQVLGWVFYGKAFFHLYFLSILLQFSLLFPLFYYLCKRVVRSFGAAVALGLVSQFLVLILNREFWQIAHPLLRRGEPLFTYPGSTLFWYMPPILLGVWIGLNWKEWPEIWRAWRSWIAVGALVSASIYMFTAIELLQDKRISSLAHNYSNMVYSAAMGLLILAFARWWAKKPWKPMQWLGERSLQIFLIHPFVLYVLGGPTASKFLKMMPFAPLWMITLCLAGTLLVTEVFARLRLNGILFSR